MQSVEWSGGVVVDDDDLDEKERQGARTSSFAARTRQPFVNSYERLCDLNVPASVGDGVEWHCSILTETFR